MFSLDEDQVKKAREFMEQQDREIAERQNKPQPYYGCSGGAYTYSFTPTSLGLIVKIRNELSKEEKDLTDYDMW